MKTFLIIGLGKFGHHLCKRLIHYNCEVMIVDTKEENLEDLLPIVTNAKIGDCANPDVVKSLGVKNFDACFVCIAEDFQHSLEVTSLLKEMGAKKVISRAERDVQAKFLLRNGADEVIYPDKDIAERVARKFSKNHIYDYIVIDEEHSIYEVLPFKDIVGKTILESDFRNKYKANIIGYKKQGIATMLTTPDYVFKEDEHLIIVGRNTDIEKYLD